MQKGKSTGLTTRGIAARYNVEEREIMRMMRGMVGTVIVAVALTAIAMMATGRVAAPQAATQRSTVPQVKAVHDPEMIDAAGYQKILAEYRGKPLLVTFWATWCEPCRAEYPMLNELAKEYAPQGLKVVGVNLDDDGDIILTRRFIARYKPVFPNYRKKAGGEAAFVDAVFPTWSGAIPASFFYAQDGRQVGKQLGEANRETYEAEIKALLGAGGN